jgi:hypothetical protein
VLLANTEAGEERVEDVLDADAARDATEGAKGKAEVLGSKFR